MKNIIICILTFFLFFISCKSYFPFASKKEKLINTKLIKKSIHLTNLEYNSIKNNDSLLYELSLSIKNKIKPKLIERRLDSFFLKSYKQKELLLLLLLDREFPNEKNPFELGLPKNVKEGIKFNDIENLKKFMKDFDSNLIKGSIRTVTTKVIKDSVKLKKDSIKKN